ncbi:mutator 2 [Xylocopa sonorina]|uniref:mutator 2 n=1 Tax=Xylocopa sonorina TaxID=1818115 RepID=UPI00403AC31D
MDILATQMCEDNDFMPTQRFVPSTQSEAIQEHTQIGVLTINCNTYPINRGINKIGRHPHSDIVLNDQTVSKKHAEIEANSREASAWICDLDSSNKTKLNNIILRPNRCYELKDGNVLEFGMVRAIYNVCGSMDESLIPETPAPNRLKKQNLIIPATPDSSLDNVSVIPATQSDNKESMFRYPSLPIKTSIGSTRKSSLQDSSIDVSLNDSRSATKEHSVGEHRISIHDMETQNSIESHNETDDDIHDVETQKICLTKKIRALAKSSHSQATNIHDLETQCEEDDAPAEVSDIHNVETQHDISIHDMKTSKQIDLIRKDTAGDDSASNIANLETSETKEGKKLTNEKDDVRNAVTREGEINISTSHPNDADKVEDKVEDTETADSPQKDLQLSLTNSDDDNLTECDESRNLLGSQPLVEFLEDNYEPSNDANLKSSSPKRVSDANDRDTSNKSTDDENIFDAATQVSKVNESPSKDAPQSVDYPFKARSLVDDSNDTDEDCVFQMYSYNRRKDSEKSSKSQLSDSEDSTTDEEGRFAEIALKQKQNVSNCFANHNGSRGGKCEASTSKDSEDLFDKLTQPVNWRTPNKKDTVKEVSFDAPTQVIDAKNPENNEKTNDDTRTMEDVDMAPTQIIRRSSNSPVKEINPLVSLTRKKGASDEEDISEIDNNAPTQIINIAEKATHETDESSSTLDPLKAIEIEDPGIVDIDYEMASTQRISDIEKEISDTCKDVSESSKSSDSIERNLNAMFKDVDDERIEEQPQISTQVLKNVLESPQCKDKLPDKNESSVDGKPTAENKPRKSTRVRKLKQSATESPSNLISNKILDAKNASEERVEEQPQKSPQVFKSASKSPERETANVDSDSSTRKSTRRSIRSRKTPVVESNDNESQSSENYFSTLTSTRKRRILLDFQDSSEPDERKKLNEKTVNEETTSKSIDTANNENISDVSSKSVPKCSSTPKSILENQSTELEHLSTPTSSKKKKNKESKAVELTSEKTNIPKRDEESGECSKNTDGQASSGSVDGEQRQQLCTILENDEDILAGLPEVRISGTISNPASPDSSKSEYRININRNQPRQVSVRIAPKREASRKSTRKSAVRKNMENSEPYRAVNKLNSSAILKSLLNSFSNNFEVNKMSAFGNVDEKVNQIVKGSVKELMPESSCKSKGSDSVPQSKSIASVDLQKERTRSSIESNRGTCNSPKEKADSSSVFQVGKEALVEKAAAEPAKRNVRRTTRGGKRSYSMVNTIESSDPKKRKQDVKVDVSAGSTDRKENGISGRRLSSSILNFVTRGDPPVNLSESSNANLDKEVVIKIPRYTPTGSMSPSTPTELVTKENGSNKTAGLRRRSSLVNTQVVSNVASKRNQKIDQHVQMRNNVNQKTTSGIKPSSEDISSEVGEESQEVEMIMNNSLKEQSIASNVETGIGKNSRGAQTRGKKRGNTNVRADDTTENSSSASSSIVYESDDQHFEAPTSKAKRARITRNTSSTSISESVKKTERTSRLPVRSTRHNQKSITDSSMEENTETTANETAVANVTRGKHSKRKTGKAKIEKQKDLINETTDTETSSSVENASVLSTPSRSRRSMSSSFSMASPLKMKHHVLFTGISNNDYGKLLKKLGASQVEDPAKCTVLVTDKVRRTFKFLCALARSIPIVSIDWLVDSEKSGHFMDLESYILKDPTAEANFRFTLSKSLEKAKDHKLLEGYTIVLTSNVTPPPLPELKSMIISCGGKPLVRPPQSWPQKAVIISRMEDMANAKKFLAKAPKTVTIQSTEFLLTGILRQELDFSEFKLT